MIAEHRNGRNPEAYKNVEQRFHFLRPSEICQVAGDHQDVGLFANVAELFLEDAQRLGGIVQIGGGGNSHR